MSSRRSATESIVWGTDEASSLTTQPGLPPGVKVDGLYEQAMRHHRQGDLETALRLYDETIRAEPEYGEAYYGRALVYYAMGNCDQSINDANRAIELRKRFTEAYLIRGAAHWGKACLLEDSDPCRRGLCEQVVSDCTWVLDAQPRNGLAHFNRGLAYMALGNKPMAKYDLENAVALLPDQQWRAEAESWLSELRKPRLLARYDRGPLA